MTHDLDCFPLAWGWGCMGHIWQPPPPFFFQPAVELSPPLFCLAFLIVELSPPPFWKLGKFWDFIMIRDENVEFSPLLFQSCRPDSHAEPSLPRDVCPLLHMARLMACSYAIWRCHVLSSSQIDQMSVRLPADRDHARLASTWQQIHNLEKLLPWNCFVKNKKTKPLVAWTLMPYTENASTLLVARFMDIMWLAPRFAPKVGRHFQAAD